MADRGKRYLTAKNNIEAGKLYDPETAIRLVKETANARFDETIEVAINLGIDPKPVSYTHLDVYKRQGQGCFFHRVSGREGARSVLFF